MIERLRLLLIGPPLPTQQLAHKRLNKICALAALSPDALSSVAYANQEIYLGLVVAGAVGLSLAFPIGIAITGLLVLVALSYFQTIHGYPTGGGSYTVAKENLGTLPGLSAAAALMVDYVLTAAVSLTSGVAAIASAFPVLWPYRVHLALLMLVAITLLNLRGLRETGTVMAVPVYLFLFTFLPMLALGGLRLLWGGPGTLAAAAPPATQPLTLFLILHTFASGCTALTGIEAISNGILVFQPPEARNAGQALIVMACLMAALFVGSIGLIQAFAIVPRTGETILSALGRRILGEGLAYILVQFSTLLILVVAANTSFTDFPRVASILARDGFFPRQFSQLGDRLVYSNGIIFLALVTAGLILLFDGDTHSLIPLFAVGAFLAFTLSQTGMVVHWWRERGQGWMVKALLNGLGAMATAVALLIITVSKFVDGAWITILTIPLLVGGFLKVRSHYQEVARELSLARGFPTPQKMPLRPRVVIPISGVHRGIVDAVNFARSIAREVTAVYIELEPGGGEQVRKKWEQYWPDVPLVILPSPYRSIVGPLLDFLDETDRQHGDGQQAVIILPEFVPTRWWHNLLHNQTAWLLKAALLYRRRRMGFQRVIIDIPYHFRR